MSIILDYGDVLFNEIKKLSYENKLGILLFLLSFIFVGIMFWACFKPSIWKDEAFSLLLAMDSYYNIVVVTSVDVHPPLYYFILKFVVSLFQSFNLKPNLVIILGRFVSVIPFVLLLILDFFKVRKYFGWLCCGVFAVCLTSMPQLMYYSVNIRMYSWALFFVTVCFVYAYGIIVDSNCKNWIILVLSGVCAAYTHYFAAVSVVIIFALLLSYFIITNDISKIKKWLLSVVISSLLYLPWIFVFINQFFEVTHNYWIKPLTLNTILNYIWFIFSPSHIFHSHSELMGILLLGSYLVLFIYFIKSNHKYHENFVFCGLFTLILTIFLGITVSILIRPVFFDRYMFPSLAIFWLTFAFLLSQSWDYKKIFVPVLIIFLIVSSISSLTFITLEMAVYNDYEKLDSFLSQDSIKDDTIILDSGQKKFILNEYEIMEYILKGYHNTMWKNSYNDLIFALNNNKKVWLFSSSECNNILQNCTKHNLTIKKYATYDGVAENGVFENHPYTIYQISL